VPITESVKVLGGICGTNGQIAAAFQKKCKQVEELHESIDGVMHGATELVLKKQCADTGKIIHTLRLNGDRIHGTELKQYTQVARDGVSRTLAGDVGDGPWIQATCGVKSGGLGIRTAEEVALPAFVASRVAVRPIVQDIFAKLEAAGLVPAGHLIGWYDERTMKATHALQAQFPEHANERDAIRTVVQQGAVAAEDWWSRAVQSDLVDVVMQEGHRPAGATLVDEDPPGEAEQSRPGAPAIQRKLSLLLDRFKLDTLMEELADAGEEEDLRRLEDLRDTH